MPFHVEPSNTEQPLLRILEDGRPLFQGGSYLRDLVSECNSKTSSIEALTSLENLEDLCDGAERCLINITRKEQEKRKREDPALRNAQDWTQASVDHQSGIDSIKRLQHVARLVRVPATTEELLYPAVANPSTRTRMKFLPSIGKSSFQDECLDMTVAPVINQKLSTVLQHKCEHAQRLIARGVRGQLQFLSLIEQLRPHWNIYLQPYADHLFSESDGSFPYRSECWVKVLDVPSGIWGIEESTHVAQEIQVPLDCWPPLPATWPLKQIWAEIFMRTTNEEAANGDNSLCTPLDNTAPDGATGAEVVVRFSGDTADVVKWNKTLGVSLMPSFFRKVKEAKSGGRSSRDTPSCSICNGPLDCEFSQMDILASQAASSADEAALQVVKVPLEGASLAANAIHTSLRTVRRAGLDRAISAVFQVQAAMLTSTEEAATSSGMESGMSIWELFPPSLGSGSAVNDSAAPESAVYTGSSEQARHVVTVELDSGATARFRLLPSVLAWDATSTTLLLRQFTFFRLVKTHTDTDIEVIQADVLVHVTFHPATTRENSRCKRRNLGGSAAGICQRCQYTLNQRWARLGRRATLGLRQHFLAAWREASRVLPVMAFDFHVPYASMLFPDGAKTGRRLLEKWLRWLASHLAVDIC